MPRALVLLYCTCLTKQFHAKKNKQHDKQPRLRPSSRFCLEAVPDQSRAQLLRAERPICAGCFRDERQVSWATQRVGCWTSCRGSLPQHIGTGVFSLGQSSIPFLLLLWQRSPFFTARLQKGRAGKRALRSTKSFPALPLKYMGSI